MEECKKQTGLKLWNSDQMSVSEMNISLDEYGQGFITCRIKYRGKEYYPIGMFRTKLAKEQWGAGNENEYYRTYSYGNGKKAYFVKDNECSYEHNEDDQTIYFTANHVLYMFDTDYSETGTKRAEELIDIIAADE